MRLGKAALVITKQKGIDFVSIGFYSQKYDSNTSDLKVALSFQRSVLMLISISVFYRRTSSFTIKLSS